MTQIRSTSAEIDGVGLVHWFEAGEGQPLVLLHGVPQHARMWQRVIPHLADRCRVIAPDLRGAGGTPTPPGRADWAKRGLAEDVHGLLGHLGATARPVVVGYDLGGGVAYAYATQHRDEVTALGILEYALPGFGMEVALIAQPGAENWQLAFFSSAPEMAERLFTGRERELLAWYFGHDADDPEAVTTEDFERYVRTLQQPGRLHALVGMFAAYWADEAEFGRTAGEPLEMPVLAVGGARASGAFPAVSMRQVAGDVREVVLDGAGHWLADEQPEALAAHLLELLDDR